MDLKPSAPPTLAIHASQMPLQRSQTADARALARAGQGFEAMLIGQMLAASARPSPFAGSLAAGSAEITAETNRLRADAVAKTAPFGVTRLLAKAPR